MLFTRESSFKEMAQKRENKGTENDILAKYYLKECRAILVSHKVEFKANSNEGQFTKKIGQL